MTKWSPMSTGSNTLGRIDVTSKTFLNVFPLTLTLTQSQVGVNSGS